MVALGDSRGPAGVEFLHEVLYAPGVPVDRKCAAVIAIAKRMQADASPLLKQRLGDRRAAVREYALRGLAAVGDGSAWDEAWDRLRIVLDDQVPSPPFGLVWATLSLQSDVVVMVCYLGRHLSDESRRERVVELIRDKWLHLYTAEQRWFDQFWAECNPTSPRLQRSGPDPQALADCAGSPLFTPVYSGT